MQNQQMALLTPPRAKMENLKNLFFQLSNSSYTPRYNEKNNKNKEDFISLDKIKQSLLSAKDKKLNSIYLIGAEPLAHPDFNQILRMCLKVSNTTVISSGVMINDKKARFLRKIDDESSFETIYRINLDSTNELKNDELRGRGSFRKSLSAIYSLLKYEFNPIINVINYDNRSKEELFSEYNSFFSKKGFDLDDINLKIIPCFPNNFEAAPLESEEGINFKKLDCTTSRVVAQSGVYSCAMLTDDYRARLGSSLDDCSKTNYLDCPYCTICASCNQKAQVNDWM